MKETGKFFSDGAAGEFVGGKNFFYGYSLAELLVHALVEFAIKNIESETALPHDHRLINAFNKESVTDGVIRRYIDIRGISKIELRLNTDGDLRAYILARANPHA